MIINVRSKLESLIRGSISKFKKYNEVNLNKSCQNTLYTNERSKEAIKEI